MLKHFDELNPRFVLFLRSKLSLQINAKLLLQFLCCKINTYNPYFGLTTAIWLTLGYQQELYRPRKKLLCCTGDTLALLCQSGFQQTSFPQQSLIHCPMTKPSVILGASGELRGTSDLPELCCEQLQLGWPAWLGRERGRSEHGRSMGRSLQCSGSLGTPSSSALGTDLSAWVAVPAMLTVKAKFSQSHLGNVRSLPRLKQGRGRGSSSQYYWKSGPFY